jgi:uncharacterized membrane protein
VQAALYAAGAIPAYKLGARAAGQPLGGLCLAAIYLCYPVAQTAVLFDLHGDTLAMPLLLFALEAMDRRAWHQYALWLALAMSCKFYVAVPVATLGLTMASQPETRRPGLITLGAGGAYGLFAFFVIRLLFTTATTAATHRGLNYLETYFGQVAQLAATALERLLTAAVVIGPAILLAWRGRRWLLPALPVAAAALFSTGPGSTFDYRYHHYATVVPFVILAAAAGIRQARAAASRPGARSWQRDLIFTTMVVALLSCLLVDQPLNPLFWVGISDRGLDSSAYGSTTRDAVMERFLAERVPPDVPLAASTFLASHLVRRETLYLTRYADDPGGVRLPAILPKVDAVVTDALFDWRVLADGALIGGIDYEAAEIATLLRNPAFALRAARDGLLFFDRGGTGLRQEIAVAETAELPASPADFGPLRLLGARITPEGGRRYLAEFEWCLTGQTPDRRLVAVSRLEGVPDARMPHLPSYVLLPTTSWRPGQVIRERFEVDLPADLAPGSYTWRTGWYDPTDSEAYATDGRSRLPGSAEVRIGSILVTP